MSLLSTKPQLLLLLLLFILLAGKAAPQPKQGCPGKCGSLTIHDPFGLTEECSLEESFLITCQQNSDGKSPTPFLGGTNVTMLNISLDMANLAFQPSTLVASDCYNKSGVQTDCYVYSSNLSRFRISTRKNTLFAVGCDTVGLVDSTDQYSEENTTTDGMHITLSQERYTLEERVFCDGIGCCKASIPSELSSLEWLTISVYNHTMVHDFNRCGYAFIEGAYVFDTSDLTSFREKSFAAVVDWAVGN